MKHEHSLLYHPQLPQTNTTSFNYFLKLSILKLGEKVKHNFLDILVQNIPGIGVQKKKVGGVGFENRGVMFGNKKQPSVGRRIWVPVKPRQAAPIGSSHCKHTISPETSGLT